MCIVVQKVYLQRLSERTTEVLLQNIATFPKYGNIWKESDAVLYIFFFFSMETMDRDHACAGCFMRELLISFFFDFWFFIGCLQSLGELDVFTNMLSVCQRRLHSLATTQVATAALEQCRIDTKWWPGTNWLVSPWGYNIGHSGMKGSGCVQLFSLNVLFSVTCRLPWLVTWSTVARCTPSQGYWPTTMWCSATWHPRTWECPSPSGSLSLPGESFRWVTFSLNVLWCQITRKRSSSQNWNYWTKLVRKGGSRCLFWHSESWRAISAYMLRRLDYNVHTSLKDKRNVSEVMAATRRDDVIDKLALIRALKNWRGPRRNGLYRNNVSQNCSKKRCGDSSA